ncbi:hypothetical protein AT302_23435 [Pandoraea norimbergensis]|uniref:Uncharacterized protein n=1 Tax=Pandoraea norimbergensis TaxID=93219 RepID=A0ABN4JMD4_9BURK|nr:hypothetical protein AT302_23435 [Pandoraea norimbergensis]
MVDHALGAAARPEGLARELGLALQVRVEVEGLAATARVHGVGHGAPEQGVGAILGVVDFQQHPAIAVGRCGRPVAAIRVAGIEVAFRNVVGCIGFHADEGRFDAEHGQQVVVAHALVAGGQIGMGEVAVFIAHDGARCQQFFTQVLQVWASGFAHGQSFLGDRDVAPRSSSSRLMRAQVSGCMMRKLPTSIAWGSGICGMTVRVARHGFHGRENRRSRHARRTLTGGPATVSKGFVRTCIPMREPGG